MITQGSTLIAHCGARKVTREELKTIPVPKATKTHQPLSHFKIVEVLEEALSFRYLKVIRDEYAVSADGMKMFGVMDLNTGFDGGNFSIGLRNSNDKSMRLALTAGLKVTVCDNMAFSGDFTPLLHKHTRNLELKDSISVAVDRIQRGFKPLEKRVAAMKDYGLTDNDARIMIYVAFLEKAIKGLPKLLMPAVHEHYFSPKYEEFAPRTLWSLSNAFTSTFKKLAPIKQFEVTAKLGAFMAQAQECSKRRPEDFQAQTHDTNPPLSLVPTNGPTQEDEDAAEMMEHWDHFYRDDNDEEYYDPVEEDAKLEEFRRMAA